MASKRKLQTRTLTEKYDILKEIDNGKKCAAAIRDYKVPISVPFRAVSGMYCIYYSCLLSSCSNMSTN